MDISPYDLDLVTRTVMGEAGNQGDSGKAAVAHVIMNRLNAGNYGKTASDVVLAPHQFEPWQTRSRELLNYSPDDPRYQQASKIVQGVVNGDIDDPTNGATHFLNPEIVKQRNNGALPRWAQGEPVAKIGAHNFYTPGKGAKDAPPDLLGTWQAAPQQGGNEDILGAWQPKAEPAAAKQPANDTPPENQSWLMGHIAKLIDAHQGEGFVDTAIRTGAGAVKGLGDVSDTLLQGQHAATSYAANALADKGIISPDTAKEFSALRDKINASTTSDNTAFEKAAQGSDAAQFGRVGGQIIGTLPAVLTGEGVLGAIPAVAGAMARYPFLASIAKGGLTGAGATALTSAASDQPLGEQVAHGAETGAVLGPLGYGVSKAGQAIAGGPVGRGVAALAQRARDEFGIPVTAGQISQNPMTRFADSVLQRLPFSGYGARTVAQQEALNSAVATEMGTTAKKITPDVVKQNLKDLGTEYDRINSSIGDVKLDSTFIKGLQNIRNNAEYNLEPAVAARIQKHLDNVLSKVDRGNLTIDAENYQYLTRKDGPLGTALNGKDSGIREYAGYIKNELENLVGRRFPDLKAAKDAADYKYFVTKSVQDLAEESPTGDISPAKLLRAVENSNTKVGDLGRIARRFMVEPPSSGTSERLLAMKGLGAAAGLTGLGGAYYFDPENFQRDMLLGAGALTAGRLGSSALRSNWLANAAIRRGLNPGQMGMTNALSIPAVGALAGRPSTPLLPAP